MAELGLYPCSRLKPAARIPLQLSHIETKTHDQCDDTTEKSLAPGDGCINVRNI